MTAPNKAKPAEEDGAKRGLRADAARNREKLLGAAEAVFKERGADASLEDVARRAEVGIGTLYRHFATRDALLAAACDARLLTLASRSRKAVESDDPAGALATYLTELVRHASIYRGLAASFGVVLQSGTPGCHATTEAGRALLERAQHAGAIRRDVELDDIVYMATAISLAASQSPSPARVVDRMIGLFVDGLRARATARRKAT